MALMPFLLLFKNNKKKEKQKKKTQKTKKKTVIDALGSWEFELLSYGLGVRKDLQ